MGRPNEALRFWNREVCSLLEYEVTDFTDRYRLLLLYPVIIILLVLGHSPIMSATAIFSISGPNYLFTSRRDHRFFFFDPSLLSSRCSSAVFFRYPYGTHKKTRTSSSTSTSIFAPAFKPYSPVMEWQDCT